MTTETTEITTEQKVRLCTGVMGWKRVQEGVKHRPTQDGLWFCVERARDVVWVYYGHSDGYSTSRGRFAPHEDTDEGLGQAVRLAEAWCQQWSGWWKSEAPHAPGEYHCVELTSERYGGTTGASGETLPLAITRAVLAALEDRP